jgi:5-formyltetrahydrofolate cyclo-ligase
LLSNVVSSESLIRSRLECLDMADEIGDRKRELRRRMREVRAAVDDVSIRSIDLWAHVRDEPSVWSARTLMAFESKPGEPDSEPFLAWCRELGKRLVVPAASPDATPPDDPASIDVAIVPGLAFTPAGERLGQGGGWYDRVLAKTRNDCVVIGVCFAAQIVDDLPVDAHDRGVDIVITEDGRMTGTPGT